MQFSDIEKIFNRSLSFSFSKKKVFLVLPVLILCGLLIVFCRALAFNASGWIKMSLIFLPILLISGVLLALGVLLIKIYYHEMKSLKISYRETLKGAFDIVAGTSYITLPPILTYLILWIVFGIFILLKEIPHIGQFIGVILSFAPFLIILSSILLCLTNLVLLFFVAPIVGVKIKSKLELGKNIFKILKKNVFSNIVLFVIAMLPMLFIVGLLTLAAFLTQISYQVFPTSLSIVVEWFFIMLPFAFFLTFAVIFFFNFSLESYNFLYKKEKK